MVINLCRKHNDAEKQQPAGTEKHIDLSAWPDAVTRTCSTNKQVAYDSTKTLRIFLVSIVSSSGLSSIFFTPHPLPSTRCRVTLQYREADNTIDIQETHVRRILGGTTRASRKYGFAAVGIDAGHCDRG